MSKYLMGFPNKKERDDFFIALVVILFFMWLFWFFLFGKKAPNIDEKIIPVAEVVAEDMDTDNDGVYDTNDKCPNIKGTKENRGCPADTDGDGIYDTEDKCPELSGVASNNGCPIDTDGDGVYDKDDRCPKINFRSPTGCPPDTDGDGIYDADDRCPKVKGDISNNGCPFSKKEEAVLIDLQSSVEFETGRAILKANSRAKLDQLANILNKKKDIKMRIEGHTDAQGDASNNLILSQDRAEACKAYLVSKGISGSRLKSVGYGERKPIATNETAEGRQRNRRVMFVGI